MSKYKKGTIITADDNKVNSMLYNRLIAKNLPSFGIEDFSSGRELEKRLNLSIDDSKLILLDNQMSPGKNGLELIKRYSLSDKWKNIPFILCTSDGAEIGREAIENGAYNYLIKPINQSKLIGVIKEALNYHGIGY